MENEICEAELNDILKNNTPNGWDKQYFMEGFDFEKATFNKSINMFECMEIQNYFVKVQLKHLLEN